MAQAHDQGVPPPTPSEARYIAVQKSPEFQDLRSRYRRWVLPVTAVSLLWYFLYVALAAYATDFMGTKLFGNINVGLVMGLASVRHDLRRHVGLRQVRRPGAGPALRPIREEMEAEGLL